LIRGIRWSTIAPMRVTAGKVVHGRVEVNDVTLPEGTDVIVGIPEDADVGFELSAADTRSLQEAIAEADRAEFADTESILATIRRAREHR
jgi:hypothetical protein